MIRVSLRDAHDKEITVVREEALNPPAVLIAGPTVAVLISDDATVTYAMIVGWRVGHGSIAEPIFATPRPQGHMLFALGKTDGLLDMNGRIFKTLKAAVEAIVPAPAADDEQEIVRCH
jgi:hypothetical protein